MAIRAANVTLLYLRLDRVQAVARVDRLRYVESLHGFVTMIKVKSRRMLLAAVDTPALLSLKNKAPSRSDTLVFAQERLSGLIHSVAVIVFTALAAAITKKASRHLVPGSGFEPLIFASTAQRSRPLSYHGGEK